MININNVVLVGRITKDPELRKTQSNTSVVQFTLAVNRHYKPEGQDQPDADFIGCLAWRQAADFLYQYCRKGDMVSVEGRIQTRNYDDQTTGKKVYVTEIVAEHVQIINREPRTTQPAQQSYYQNTQPANPQPVQSQPVNQPIYQAPQYQEQLLADPNGKTIFGGKIQNSGPSLDISSDDLPFY